MPRWRSLGPVTTSAIARRFARGGYTVFAGRGPRGIKNKPEYERLETERFIRRHGITQFRRNPFFPVNTEQLVARGPFGAPTFFVGEDIFFGKDRLRDVEEAILASPQ
jgi:2-hydroxychromene-2-carboxylate isomerase